jgi:hypothetical protein
VLQSRFVSETLVFFTARRSSLLERFHIRTLLFAYTARPSNATSALGLILAPLVDFLRTISIPDFYIDFYLIFLPSQRAAAGCLSALLTSFLRWHLTNAGAFPFSFLPGRL